MAVYVLPETVADTIVVYYRFSWFFAEFYVVGKVARVQVIYGVVIVFNEIFFYCLHKVVCTGCETCKFEEPESYLR